jgi:Tol biopolymer transport system component
VEGSNCTAEHGGTRSIQVFARLGGTRTLEVSKPLAEAKECGEMIPCKGAGKRASAYFKGASEDGSRVFFTTTQSLTGEGEGEDLYMATIACPGGEAVECAPAEKQVASLTLVSHPVIAGQSAEVKGITRLAPDGSRVYFVAGGVLTEGVNAQGGAPVKEADNLYVYDTASGKIVFVADLCSGPQLSGAVVDAHCPRDLSGGGEVSSRNDIGLWGFAEAQSDRQGRFLVFSTFAQLLSNDTDNAKDVYRYDAETGGLDRVSLGEAGYDANGNRNDTAKLVDNTGRENADSTIAPGHMGQIAEAVGQQEMASRAISEDGSRIVFSTAEPLSPAVSNGPGLTNVYEWHQGSVALVSGGAAEESDSNAVISPSGQNIFFTTTQGLVPLDTDGLRDVYDARLGGGFAPAPAERQPCSGDACQGPLTNPAPLLVPGSVPQAPGENLSVPTETASPKGVVSKCSKGKKLSHGKCVKAKSKKITKAKKARKTSRGGGHR